MEYRGFFKIFMITLISRKKNLGGYKIMKHTVYLQHILVITKIKVNKYISAQTFKLNRMTK